MADSSFADGSAFGISSSPSVSSDGQLVAFQSTADNLVANDTNGQSDVFVYDRGTNSVSLVSIGLDGSAVGRNAPAIKPVISPDGRYVAFETDKGAVVNGIKASAQLYLRDLLAGTTTLLTPNAANTGGASAGYYSMVFTADSKHILFDSDSTFSQVPAKNLTTDSVTGRNIFERNLETNQTVLVSVDKLGHGAGISFEAPVTFTASNDGRYVAFVSNSDSYSVNDLNSNLDTYVRDVTNGTTILVSVDSTSLSAVGNSGKATPTISGDGRFVTFVSDATILSSVDPKGGSLAYVRDLQLDTTTAVSVPLTGSLPSFSIAGSPVISANGQTIVFVETASLIAADTNSRKDLYAYSLSSHTLTLVSSNSAGTNGGNADSGTTLGGTTWPATVTPNGRYVFFRSGATNLVNGVFTIKQQLYRRDLFNGTTLLISEGSQTAASSGHETGNADSDTTAASDDGRFVAFESASGNLQGASESNGRTDVFLRDISLGSTSLASLKSPDLPSVVFAEKGGSLTSMSANGRYLAINTTDGIQTGLQLPSDIAPYLDVVYGSHVLVRDTQTGLATFADLTPDGQHALGSDLGVISSNGRYVAFRSNKDLDAAHPNPTTLSEVFVRDLQTNTTTLISRRPDNGLAELQPNEIAISASGRYVAWTTRSATLVNGLTGDSSVNPGHIYVWDRVTSTIRLVDHVTGSSTQLGNGVSYGLVFSPDESKLAFVSTAGNLVSNVTDTNSKPDLFVFNLSSSTVTAASVTTTGSAMGNGTSGDSALLGGSNNAFSSDGRFLFFTSAASNLVATDTNNTFDVFRRDLLNNVTILVSVNSAETDSGNRISYRPSVSADGLSVAFQSEATNLMSGFVNGNTTNSDIFVRNLVTNTTTLASPIAGSSTTGSNNLSQYPTISPDGRYVSFTSVSSDLVTGFVDGNGVEFDLFVRDLQTGQTLLVTLNQSGTASGLGKFNIDQTDVRLFGTSGKLFFNSTKSDLVSGDRNQIGDVFSFVPAGVSSIGGTIFTDSNGNGILNSGEAGVSNWIVYIDSSNNGLLDPNDSRLQTDASGAFTFSSLAPGTYRLRILDRNGYLQTTANPLIVTIASDGQAVTGKNIGVLQESPDLSVTSVTAPSTAKIGSTANVSWTVHNAGTAISGSWQDAVYLSLTPTLGSDAILLTTASHSGGLAKNANYNGSTTVTWPAAISGDYYVIVQTDRRNQVHNDSNLTNRILSAAHVTTLNFQSSQPLVLNSPYSADSFSAVGQEYYYQIVVPPNSGSLGLQLTSMAGSGGTSIYLRRGAIPTPWEFDLRSNDANSPNQFLVYPEAQAGTYYLMVRAESGAAATAAFTILPEVSTGIRIVNIDRSSGGRNSQITVGIRGLNFSPQATVRLTSGSTVVNATNVVFHDRSQLFATFDLHGVAAGTFDVEVHNGSDSDTLNSAFTVEAARQDGVSVKLIAPERVRYGRQNVVVIEYSNNGNTDLVAPMLLVYAEDNKALFRNADQPSFQSSITQIFATSPDGPAGLLRPGQTGRVYVPFTSNTLIPHDPINITVGAVLPLLAIDWNAVKASAKPTTIQSDAWDAIWSNFTAMIGTTTSDYNFRLAQAATYLGDLGIDSSDLGRLFSFLIAQSNAAFPTPTLSTTLDAQLQTPGLSLTLDRTYGASISARYQSGLLGRGWTTSWETKLIDDEVNGIVTIQTGSNGRIFIRDSGDGWQAAAGDFATLSHSIDGFTLTESNGQQSFFSPRGQLLEIADFNGNRISLGYDASNRLTTLTHSNGLSLTLSYNAQNHVSQVTDSAGRLVSYSYDGAGGAGDHLIAVTSVQGTTNYQYISGQGATKDHALSQITFADGTHLYFGYDSIGRLSSTSRDGGAVATTFAYPGDGEVVATDALNHSATVWFNDVGMPEKISDPNGSISAFDYDNSFDLVRFVNPTGAAYANSYNATGFITQIVDPLGHTVNLDYSGESQNLLSKVVDARGYATSFDYSDNGNLMAITYPGGGQESFSYDPLGNLTETLNRRGNAIHYTVDGRGRTTRIDFADNSFQTFSYDDFDNLTQFTDSTGTTTLEYDDASNDPAQNRLTTITYPDRRFLVFSYDSAGRRTTSVDQSSFTVKYSYDAAGRLLELRNTSNALIVHYTYDATGLLIQKDNGNGTRTNYDYDPSGQLLAIRDYKSTTPSLVLNSQISYTYDAAGRRISTTDSTGTTNYQYDDAGQLTVVSMAGGRKISYKYDASGNRTQVTDTSVNGGLPVAYSVNSENEITAIGSDTYAYDADGNLLSTTIAGNTTTYAYNDLNQLTAISSSVGASLFFYNALGDRTAATRSGVTTHYLVDPVGLHDVVGEYSTSGSVNYVYGSGLVSRSGTGGTGYYEFDGNGNTTGITKFNGTYLNQYSYLPFGETTGGGTLPNPFTFVGQFGVMQESSSLSFMRARYYSSTTAQFVSNDPLGLGGGDINVRRYATNSPVTRIDPIGLDDSFGGFLFIVAEYEIVASQAEARIIYNNSRMRQLDHIRDRAEINRLSDESVRLQNYLNILTRSGFLSAPAPSPPKPPAAPAVPTTPRDTGRSESLTANDPNDLIGPAGFGDANYVLPIGDWSYTIEFENKPDASAPAQDVVVAHQLNNNLDWNSFELGTFGFGSTFLTIPSGLQQYQTSVDYQNADGSPLRVDVKFTFSQQTGLLTVTLRSIDPATGIFPEDVLAGFLPPDDFTNRGQGFLQYFVKPKPGLSSGTTIDQTAKIVFDANPSIDTPTFTNTIDVTPPTSTITATASTKSFSQIDVSWNGIDADSGIAAFDIYVSDNGGSYATLLSSSLLTSTVFKGVSGHQYRFYSVAIDNLGNREAAPVIPGATVSLLSTITGPAATTTSLKPKITWMPIPGATSYDVWITNLSTNTAAYLLATSTTATFTPTSNLEIGRFRVWIRGRASDGTLSVWTAGHDFRITSRVTLKSPDPLQTTFRPKITWFALAGADHYDVWISKSSSGSTPLIRSTNVSSTSFTVPFALPIGSYRVWVRAIAADGSAAAWSTSSSFSISIAPAITAGQNAAFDRIPTLTWNALLGADNYDIWINNLTTGATQVVRITEYTSTTFTDSTAWPIGRYRAWVRGITVDGFGSGWTAPIDFTINGAPTLTAGLNSTFDRTPRFAWDLLSGAAKYEFYLVNYSTGETIIDRKNMVARQFNPSSDLSDGHYRWRVRGFTAEGFASLWSSPIDIYVGGRTELLTPIGTATSKTPIISWNPVDGADHYDLWVNHVEGAAQIIRMANLTSPSFSPTSPLPSGQFRAWIRAISVTGEVGLWSQSRDFSVAANERFSSFRHKSCLALLDEQVCLLISDSSKQQAITSTADSDALFAGAEQGQSPAMPEDANTCVGSFSNFNVAQTEWDNDTAEVIIDEVAVAIDEAICDWVGV